MAVKVTLSKKPISRKRHSLYLDFYPAVLNSENGEKTRREFLDLSIFDNTRNPLDKLHNTNTLNIAEQIRQKKESEFNKPEIYSTFEQEQIKKNLKKTYAGKQTKKYLRIMKQIQKAERIDYNDIERALLL